jgi:hypothetical protein
VGCKSTQYTQEQRGKFCKNNEVILTLSLLTGKKKISIKQLGNYIYKMLSTLSTTFSTGEKILVYERVCG